MSKNIISKINAGDKFGRLTVIEYAYSKNNTRFWYCKCECGGERCVSTTALNTGSTRSCGCLRRETTVRVNKERAKNPELVIGHKYERLTVIEINGDKCRCECDCGIVKEYPISSIRNKKSKSCGCLRNDRIRATIGTHGMSGTKEYIRAHNKKYWAENQERLNAARNKRRENNPEQYSMYSINRRARKKKAQPFWARKDTNKYLSKLTKERNAFLEDGQEYHIDHIVPLTGKVNGEHVVCGLHVWYNLQLLPAEANLSKNCYVWPDMWDY